MVQQQREPTMREMLEASQRRLGQQPAPPPGQVDRYLGGGMGRRREPTMAEMLQESVQRVAPTRPDFPYGPTGSGLPGSMGPEAMPMAEPPLAAPPPEMSAGEVAGRSLLEAATGATTIPPERIETGVEQGYGLMDFLRGADLETLERIAQDEPELAAEMTRLRAMQAESVAAAQAQFPGGFTDQSFGPALQALIQQQQVPPAPPEAWRATAPTPGAWEQPAPEWSVQRQIEMAMPQAVPGVHLPPITDEQIRATLAQQLEQAAAQRHQQYREQHPLISTGAHTAGTLAPFLGGAGVAGGALRASGLAARMSPAAAGALQFAGASAGMGAMGAITHREPVGPAAARGAVSGAVLGAAGAGAGGAVQRFLAGKVRPSLVQRAVAAANIAGMEGAAEVEKLLVGGGEPETIAQKIVRLGVMVGGSQALHRIFEPTADRQVRRAVTRTRDEMHRMQKQAERVPQDLKGKEVEFPDEGGKVGRGKVVLQTQKGQALVEVEGGRRKVVTQDELRERSSAPSEPSARPQPKAPPAAKPEPKREAPPPKKPEPERTTDKSGRMAPDTSGPAGPRQRFGEGEMVRLKGERGAGGSKRPVLGKSATGSGDKWITPGEIGRVRGGVAEFSRGRELPISEPRLVSAYPKALAPHVRRMEQYLPEIEKALSRLQSTEEAFWKRRDEGKTASRPPEEMRALQDALLQTKDSIARLLEAPGKADAVKAAVEAAAKALGQAEAMRATWGPGEVSGRRSERGGAVFPINPEAMRAMAIRSLGAVRLMRRVLGDLFRWIRALPRQHRTQRAERAAVLLRDAHQLVAADGQTLGPRIRDELLKQLKSDPGVVRDIGWIANDHMRIRLASGKTLDLYHPDGRSRFQAVARELSNKRVWNVRDARTAERAFADLIYEAQTGSGAWMTAPVRALARGWDRARGVDPRDPASMTERMSAIGRDFMGEFRNKEFQDLDTQTRAEASQQFARLRNAQHRALELLRDDAQGHLSEAMWLALQHAGELRGVQFGEARVAEAYQVLKQIRDVYSWAGRIFASAGYLSPETVQKHAETYTHWMGGGKHVRSKSAYAAAFMEFTGASQALSVTSLRHARATFFKHRERTLEEHIRYGGRTDIQSSIEGAAKQISAATQARLLERVANTPELVRDPDALPTPEKALLRRAASLERERDAHVEMMAKERIPRLHGLPEKPEAAAARGKAWKRVDRHRARMEEDKIPFEGMPEGADAKLRERVGLAQGRLARLETAAFKATRLPRFAGVQAALFRHPTEKPRFGVKHSVTIRANARLDYLEGRLREIREWERRWQKVPDDPVWGPLVKKVTVKTKDGKEETIRRGMYVDRDVWREVRHLKTDLSDFYSTLSAINVLGKKAKTSWRLATHGMNLPGNLGMNAEMGMEVTSKAGVQALDYARRAVHQYTQQGTLPESMPKDVRQAVQEFIDRAYMTAVPASVELRTVPHTARVAFERSGEALSKGQSGSGMLLGIKGLVEYSDYVISHKLGPLSKALRKMEDWYAVEDQIPALALYISLRTGRGSKYGEPLPPEVASRPIDLWYNYRKVPAPFKHPIGRLAWTFGRFLWKRTTGPIHALFTAPFQMGVPRTPARVTVRGRAYGKSRTAQKATAAASAAALAGLKLGKYSLYYSLAHTIARNAWDMDEDEYEKKKLASVYGNKIQSMFLIPLPFKGRWINPYGWLTTSQLVAVAEEAPGPPREGPEAWLRTIIRQNLFASKAFEVASGESDFRGELSKAQQWTTIADTFVPGTLAQILTEIVRHTRSYPTSKTIAESILAPLGFRIAEYNEHKAKIALERMFLREGWMERRGGALRLTDEGRFSPEAQRLYAELQTMRAIVKAKDPNRDIERVEEMMEALEKVR